MKILFVVSDGHPNGHGYDGNPAYKHTGECVEKTRNLYGCEVYGIGVNNAFTDSIGRKLYGEGYFTILGDVKTSMYILTRFMRQIAMRV
jgi:nitric oxide reductase activation protein